MQPIELIVDLALQVARVGRDPDRRAVLLRPQAGGRHVTQCLADAGAGLDQHDIGLVLLQARREGLGRGGGIVALRRPRFGQVGTGRDHLREPQPRLARIDRLAAGRRGGWRLFPRRQALPDVEAGAGARLLSQRRIDIERLQDRAAPGPVAARHGERDVLELGRGERCHVFQRTDQRLGDPRQRGELVFGRRADRHVDRGGKAAHRRQAEGGRVHEGEKLQQVARRQIVEAQARRDRRRMHHHRRRVRGAQGRLRRRDPLDRALRRQPQGAAGRRDECGNEDNGHGFQMV